jgi:hypothetical protein
MAKTVGQILILLAEIFVGGLLYIFVPHALKKDKPKSNNKEDP